MKNRKKKIITLLLSSVLAVCCSIPVFADSAPGNLANDSVITTKIKAKMLADPSISSLNISVDTNNGVVTLSGTVPSDKEATNAIVTAESTDDVKNVDASKLIVQKSDYPFADTVITAKVKGLYLRDKVFGDKPVALMGVVVETKNGIVYLTGKATRAEAANAIRLAKTIDGVKSVNSKINIQ